MFWAVRVRITWDVCVADIEAWNLLQALFFKTGNHVFTPSRWTKIAPAMQQWARGLTTHGVMKAAYLNNDVLLEDTHLCIIRVVWVLLHWVLTGLALISRLLQMSVLWIKASWVGRVMGCWDGWVTQRPVGGWGLEGEARLDGWTGELAADLLLGIRLCRASVCAYVV